MSDQSEIDRLIEQAIIHLKTDIKFFDSIWNGKKNFEVRKSDRDYQIGSILVLKEYKPKYDTYTGRVVAAKVTYILSDESFPEALSPGYIVMGLEFIAKEKLF